MTRLVWVFSIGLAADPRTYEGAVKRRDFEVRSSNTAHRCLHRARCLDGCFSNQMNQYEAHTPEVSGNLKIIIGLPGSGKTAYINSLVQKNTEFIVYDDYQGKSYGDDSDPRLSRHFGPLINDLKKGKTVIVSDIR